MGTQPDFRELVGRHAGEVTDLLVELIRRPSPTGQEGAVLAHLREWLAATGLASQLDAMGNLLVRVGSGPRLLAFDAHVDTVGPGDSAQWTLPPYSGRVRSGRVHGRGAADQKGGVAALALSTKLLAETGPPPGVSVLAVFSVMEEDCEGLCWSHLIEVEGVQPEAVVLTEPTGLGVAIGHRGRMEVEVGLAGRSAHGSAPERGVNAIGQAARAVIALEALHERLPVHPGLGRGSLAVTAIEAAGPSLCAIPDFCRLHLDRRLTPGEDRDGVLAELRAVLGRDARLMVPCFEHPSHTGWVRRQEQVHPAWSLDAGDPLVQAAAAAVADVVGRVPPLGAWAFATNGVTTCGRHGIPTVGVGPGQEELAHAPNESVALEEVTAAAAIYASLAHRWAAGAGGSVADAGCRRGAKNGPPGGKTGRAGGGQ